MYSWLYSSNGTPRLHSDGYNDLKYAYSYDSIGRLIRTDISEREGGAYVGSTEYGYDPRGNMTSIQNEIGGVTYTQSHIYAQTKDENDEVIIGSLANSKDGLPTRYSIFSNRYADYYYDSLSRRTMRKFRVGTTDDPIFLYNLYTYKDSQRNASGSDTYQTTLLESETVAGTSYAYKYDKVGNITEITRNDKAYHSYQYDEFGQLVRDDSATGGTYIWTYDDLGNITSRKKYAYTTGDISSATPSETIEYHYGKADNAGWNNILTGVDFNGNGTVDETEKILYDEIGNPTTYLGANMWWKGRQLTSYRKDGVDLLFTYDASGLRGSKNVGSVKTTYQYVGDKLYYENRGNGKELYYFYDSFNNLSAISYFNGTEHTMYYALTNSQGDVLGLYDAWGKKVAAYDYDAWGNATVYEVTQDENGNNVHTVVTEKTDHISYVNPIRYRGYYYDDDLGLYYLQSRYYDSTVGRFINADGYITTGQGVLSYNMFSYCNNNSIAFSDPSGNSFIAALLGGIVLIGVLALSGCSKSTKSTPKKSPPPIVQTTTKSQDLTPKQEKDKQNLALTIYGEQHGTSVYDNWKAGQEAVAWTIINRYNSSDYPSDWTKIVTAENQFVGYSATVALETNSLDPIAWDYANTLATNMVTGQYNNIAYPSGFTDEHMFFRADEGQSYDDWGGIVRVAGNVFFYYR